MCISTSRPDALVGPTLVRGVLQGEGDIGEVMELTAWIFALADRLERHELTNQGPITLRDGSRFPDVELAVKTMLADLAHQHALAASRRFQDPLLDQRHRELMADFQHLREQLAS
jgi:hypothetical protein